MRAPARPAIVVLAPDLQSAWTGDALRAGIRAVLPGDIGRARDSGRGGSRGRWVGGAASAGYPGALVAERVLPAGQVQALTPREVQVLAMLAEGHGNKTIAWKLGISEHTAKFHVASILSKLNAGTRTEAVTLGIRRGLIMV